MVAGEITGTVFLAIGISFFVLAFMLLRKGLAITRWVAMPGEIVTSELATLKRYGFPTAVVAKIEYTYWVGGTAYTSDKIMQYGTVAYGESVDIAEKAIEKYPVGLSVTVYYNPKNHREAVLETSLYKRNLISLAVLGSICAIVGIVLLAIYPM